MAHYGKWKIGQNQVCFLLNHSLPSEVLVLQYWTWVLLLCTAKQNPLFGLALCYMYLSHDIFRHKQGKVFMIILERFWKEGPRSLLKHLKFWVSMSQWGHSWYATLLAISGMQCDQFYYSLYLILVHYRYFKSRFSINISCTPVTITLFFSSAGSQ